MPYTALLTLKDFLNFLLHWQLNLLLSFLQLRKKLIEVFS